MQLTIFGKPQQGEKNNWTKYLTKLKLKSGDVVTAQVLFTEGCKPPRITPCNIIVKPGTDMSAPEKAYLDNEGKKKMKRVCYIRDYEPGEEYVDHTCDDLEDI